jgi:hypothetical protein
MSFRDWMKATSANMGHAACIAFCLGFIYMVGRVVVCFSRDDVSNVAHLRGEAVSRGYAEWCVDPQTGTATFQWKAKP